MDRRAPSSSTPAASSPVVEVRRHRAVDGLARAVAVAVVGVADAHPAHCGSDQAVRLVVGEAVGTPRRDVSDGVDRVGRAASGRDAVGAVVGVPRRPPGEPVARRVVGVAVRAVAEETVQPVVALRGHRRDRAATHLRQRLGICVRAPVRASVSRGAVRMPPSCPVTPA